MKKVSKEALINTKMGKYVVAKHKGNNKSQAARIAGYAESMALHGTHLIEKSQTYQELEKRYFKDELLAQTTLTELGNELLKVVRQDENLNAKNVAIAMAIAKIEPPEKDPTDDEANKVFVLLK